MAKAPLTRTIALYGMGAGVAVTDAVTVPPPLSDATISNIPASSNLIAATVAGMGPLFTTQLYDRKAAIDATRAALAARRLALTDRLAALEN